MSARVTRIAGLMGLGFLAGAQAFAPALAHADVPRSCVVPRSDPIECARETRLVHLDVLPSARIRVLEKQRLELERLAPLQDRERNRLLEEIRDELRAR